jgi:molybdenum cofactor cytidylyltransferase
MKLIQAFHPNQTTRMAFVGAGGKTSAIFRLAREMAGNVWVSASAHLAEEQLRLAHSHVVVGSEADIHSSEGVTVFTGPLGKDGRTEGLSFELLESLHRLAEDRQVPLLIEADGSRRKPLKAPAGHEPPIPPFVDTVVVVAGLTGLGQPLDEEWVHRPQRFAALSGLKEGEKITPDALAKALLHPEGGLKNIPPEAKKIALLNQADDLGLAGKGKKLAKELLGKFDAVIVAQLAAEGDNEALAVHQQIGAVVMAAGGSGRLGEPKQLLDWRGEPFIRVVAKTALASGLSPVVVITGAYHESVELALEGLAVKIVHNQAWEEGQSGSVKLGLAAMPEKVGGVLFFLVDQPQIPASLALKLVETHAETLAPIVAPMVDGRRGNPVLFDRAAFPDLMQLAGDVGGRGVFSKHPVTWVPWVEPSAGMDVDTPEDYARLLRYED